MKLSLKFIVTFTLLMLSYSIKGSTMDFSNCVSNSDCICQLSESFSDDTYHSSIDNHTLGADISHSLSETYTNNYRLRRISEVNDFLKDVMHKFFLLRENSLVLDQSKSYYSDKDPHYSIICSDYYVFALRHILI